MEEDFDLRSDAHDLPAEPVAGFGVYHYIAGQEPYTTAELAMLHALVADAALADPGELGEVYDEWALGLL